MNRDSRNDLCFLNRIKIFVVIVAVALSFFDFLISLFILLSFMLMFWVGCLLLFDFWTSVSTNWENNQPILFHVYFPCTNLFFADKFLFRAKEIQQIKVKFSNGKSNFIN